jgi:hypothetical protein
LFLNSRSCFIVTEQKKGPQPHTIGSYEEETYSSFTHLNKTSGSDTAIDISFLQTQNGEWGGRANTVNYTYMKDNYDYGDDDGGGDTTKRRSCSTG